MNFAERWRVAWKMPVFRLHFLRSTLSLFVVLILARLLLDHLESRSGSVLMDPLLGFIARVDLRWLVWTMTYSGILLGLVYSMFQPLAFLLSIRAVIALTLLRLVCLLALPLDPPAGYIPLVDPIVTLPFFQPVLTRDLFFSWHVAVVSLFAFIIQGRDMKLILGVLTGLIAVCLLFQHAQYTISLITAPCFAYAAFGIARLITFGGFSRRQPGNGSAGTNKPTWGALSDIPVIRELVSSHKTESF